MRPRLLVKLRTLLGNEADAQDALQTAFLHCWRARAGLDQVRNVRGWIWRVGVNAGRDLQKCHWRRRVRSLALAGEEPLCRQASPAGALLRQEEQERLRSALEHLRPAEREVFSLRHEGALTFQEIADRRGCPVGTAKPLMRTAVRKLRHLLQEGEN
jgi:RNA polymerase sigma-70 factor (ECF subfamily)